MMTEKKDGARSLALTRRVGEGIKIFSLPHSSTRPLSEYTLSHEVVRMNVEEVKNRSVRLELNQDSYQVPVGQSDNSKLHLDARGNPTEFHLESEIVISVYGVKSNKAMISISSDPHKYSILRDELLTSHRGTR